MVSNALGEALSPSTELKIIPDAWLIDFDDLEAGCVVASASPVTSEYEHLGVTFEGPGGAPGRYDALRERALVWAFVLWQLGRADQTDQDRGTNSSENSETA